MKLIPLECVCVCVYEIMSMNIDLEYKTPWETITFVGMGQVKKESDSQNYV